MATNAQIIANQKNAFKGGPKTIEGKLIASRNATKHGLLAQNVLIKTEELCDWEAFRDAIFEDVSPTGAMEELLTEKVIAAAWRLQRLVRVECAIFDGESTLYSSRGPQDAFDGASEQLHTLMRYEASLERAFYRAIHELQRLQGMRLGQPVMASIAIELNGEGSKGPEGDGFV